VPEQKSKDQPAPPNYITPGGARRLKEELHRLLATDRPEVVRTVSWAASNGDRSENGDYIYGKRRLREIDRRIRFLQKRLEAARVVDPLAQKGDRVVFGATVTVADEDGDERTYRIVGIDESEPTVGKVSWISPLAKTLMGARVGDGVTLRTPKGEEELEVLEVRFVAIE
jgi:transcription elongation factor GreB